MSIRPSLMVAALATFPVITEVQERPPVCSAGKLTADQQVAREIYRELIEINIRVTTGNVTTPVSD